MDFRRLKIQFVKIDFSNLFLNWFRGSFVQGDQIGRGPFVQGDPIVGDRLSRGTKLAGDRLYWGPNLGDQMGSGPNALGCHIKCFSKTICAMYILCIFIP